MEIEDGVFLAVAESHCQYRYPARFDDEVIVRTSIEKVTTRMVTFAYEMRLEEFRAEIIHDSFLSTHRRRAFALGQIGHYGLR